MKKSWLVTGTSSGFGRELLEILLNHDCWVAATVRQPSALDGLKAKFGKKLNVYQLDVTDTSNVHRTIETAFRDLGQIDVVVSNAGYAVLGAAEEVSDEQIERQIATNLVGSIQVLRSAVPYLRRQGGGRLIQLGSMGGQISLPALSLYHATKWGIEGFCESLAQEVAPFGIYVTVVEPGGASTNFAGASASIATPLDVYDENPVGQLRRMAASGAITMPVDPRKVAEAIVAVADEFQPPLRLALGSDAYGAIRAGLTSRLDSLDARKQQTLAADVAAH